DRARPPAPQDPRAGWPPGLGPDAFGWARPPSRASPRAPEPCILEDTMYVVINNEAVWGVGETEAEAIDSAIEWVCSSDEDGRQVREVAPIVSYHELRNGAAGFAVLPASAEYVGR